MVTFFGAFAIFFYVVALDPVEIGQPLLQPANGLSVNFCVVSLETVFWLARQSVLVESVAATCLQMGAGIRVDCRLQYIRTIAASQFPIRRANCHVRKPYVLAS